MPLDTPMLSDTDLRRRITACWLGKAVGGTLGMPYEGVRHPLNLTFYDPVPTEMLPNDDLDLQVVYAFLLDRLPDDAIRVDRHVLADAWQHVGMSPDEYGVCKRNLALGLRPPVTGSYDNPFARGMGAAIRTELWACLAPGDPDLAVKYAYEDACMDHAGEGIDAAVFLAAIEALAFVETDRDALLDAGLKHIPHDSELAAAIRDTRVWWTESVASCGGDWRAVQARLAERYLNDNFTDVVINLAYTVLGWLAGCDFGESICVAVNCGQDTDCTGATLGALLGILDPNGIDDKWLAPIGRELVLSPSIHGVEHPPTLDGFTDLVLDLRRRLDGKPPAVDDDDQPTDHLAVPARLGSAGAMPDTPASPDSLTPTTFDGLHTILDPSQFAGRVTVVRYEVDVDATDASHLMFNCRQPTRVWWDERLVIDSPGGGFVPAPHRTVPGDQNTPLGDASGGHTITAAMTNPTDDTRLEWCVALTDDAPEFNGWRVARNWRIKPWPRVTLNQ